MVNKYTLFLETTIQIDRVIGEQSRRDVIRNNIHDRSLATSGHVLAEYNKTLMRDAVTFRNLLLTSNSVEEAVKRFTKKYSRQRKYPRTIELLATLGFDKDKHTTLDRLECFIDWQGHSHFWANIDKSLYIDNIKCTRNRWKPKRNRSGEYNIDELSCLRKYPNNCDVMSFITLNKNSISKLVKKGKTSKLDNVKKAANLLDEIINNNAVPYGERNCYSIADTLIVIELPNEYQIYSSDDDIHEICRILEKMTYKEI